MDGNKAPDAEFKNPKLADEVVPDVSTRVNGLDDTETIDGFCGINLAVLGIELCVELARNAWFVRSVASVSSSAMYSCFANMVPYIQVSLKSTIVLCVKYCIPSLQDFLIKRGRFLDSLQQWRP